MKSLKHFFLLFFVIVTIIAVAYKNSDHLEEFVMNYDRNAKKNKFLVNNQTLRKSATKGNAEAMWRLGNNHINNRFGDRVVGLKWIEKAANNNHVLAQCFLGVHYFEKDQSKSKAWFEKAANNGEPLAMMSMSDMEQDQLIANKWKQKAFLAWKAKANLGGVESKLGLARCYRDGIGVPMNKRKAIEWYESIVFNHDPNDSDVMNAKLELSEISKK